MAKQVLRKYVPFMVYKYRWLDQALVDLDQEVGYVFSEFGVKAAREAEATIHECVSQLCSFPNLGMNYEALEFHGNEVRILHIKQVSLIYCVDVDLITLIALWNSHRDEKTLKTMVMSRQ